MGWLIFACIAALIYVAADTAGIHTGRDLSDCLDQNEQTILLRQMALTGKAKDDLDYCLSERMVWTSPRQVTREDWCRGLYIDANRPVQACMFRKGYTFMDIDRGYTDCDWSEFRKRDCYKSKWLALVDAVSELIQSKL